MKIMKFVYAVSQCMKMNVTNIILLTVDIICIHYERIFNHKFYFMHAIFSAIRTARFEISTTYFKLQNTPF